MAPLDRADATHLTFLANAKYASLAAERDIGVLLVTPELVEHGKARARIVVKNPHEAMLPLLPLLYPPVRNVPGIDPTATLGRGVTLGSDVPHRAASCPIVDEATAAGSRRTSAAIRACAGLSAGSRPWMRASRLGGGDSTALM